MCVVIFYIPVCGLPELCSGRCRLAAWSDGFFKAFCAARVTSGAQCLRNVAFDIDISLHPFLSISRQEETQSDQQVLAAQIGIVLIGWLLDADSPFASPNWRDEVRGVSITIKGYDTVSCDEVAANHFYYTQDGGIVEGRRFSDANTRASMANLEYGLQGKKQRLTSIFDYDRLDELV